MIIVTLICCHTITRVKPVNYILLVLFTGCSTFFLAYVCSFLPVSQVITGAAMTFGVAGSITAYAMTTKENFKFMVGFLWLVSAVLILLALSYIVFSFSAWWHPLVQAFLSTIVGIFFLWDTERIVVHRRYGITHDDYIVGALMLYADVIMIFVDILACLRCVEKA